MHKIAKRARTLLESLATFVSTEGGDALRRLPGWRTEEGGDISEAPAGLDADSERPPCLALFGEFSAGKSSLANLLIGTDMLPTSVLSTTRLPTRLRYAESLQISTIASNGERRALDPDQIRRLTREHVGVVEIGLPSPILKKIEILDTPGFADPYHDPQLSLDVVEEAELAIWCTLASQAWRQTEQFTWKEMPEQLRSNSLLVVTHVDQLREETDLAQLEVRLRREAGPWFRDIVLLSVPDAARARGSSESDVDQALWETSGGAALVAKLETCLSSVGERRTPTGDDDGDAEGLEQEPVAGGSPRSAKGALPKAKLAPDVADALNRMEEEEETDDDGAGDNPDDDARISRKDDAPPAPAPRIDVDETLADLLSGIPDCHAAAYVDLEERKPLAVKATRGTSSELNDRIAALTASLLRGEPVEEIRSIIEAHLGLAREARDEFREITVQTEERTYVMLRQTSRPDRAVIVICARRANVSLALLRMRRGLEALDPPPSGEMTAAAQ